MKRFLAISIGIFFFTACLLHFWYPNPWNHGIFAARQSPNVQSGHAIGLALYSYANEHGGNYPSGVSSTEVFQILLDGGYATNPRIFYVPMPGKIDPQAGQKLKPENVGWDFYGWGHVAFASRFAVGLHDRLSRNLRAGRFSRADDQTLPTI